MTVSLPSATIAPPVMSERRTGLMGGILVAVGPVSLALYTPAMPLLAQTFSTDASVIKLTLVIYFLGFCVTQLVCGPLSDAFGRRVTAMAFMGLYLAGAILAILAPTIEVFLVARLLQGIGASVGVATARAIVRDQFTGESSSRIMTTVGIVLALGPAVSPTIGGILLDLAGWSAVFGAMVAFGAAVIVACLLVLKETTVPDPARITPAAVLRSYAALLSSRHFMATSLTVAGAVGTLYALATLLPFLLIEKAGLTPTQFGAGMLAQSGMFLAGSLVLKLLMRRLAAERLVPVGLAFIVAADLALVASVALLPVSYLSIMLPVGLCAFGIALVMPAMTTASLAPFPQMAGAASAMMGFIQMGAGLAGGLASAAIGDPVTALPIVIPGLGATALLAYLVFRLRPAESIRTRPE